MTYSKPQCTIGASKCKPMHNDNTQALHAASGTPPACDGRDKLHKLGRFVLTLWLPLLLLLFQASKDLYRTQEPQVHRS